MADKITEALDEIRTVLNDHERRLYPVNRRGLPEPSGRIDANYVGMVGDVWDITPSSAHVQAWRVLVLDPGTDDADCVYVHTPHSLVAPSFGDSVAMRPTEARELAAAILAAVDRIEGRERAVSPLKAGDQP